MALILEALEILTLESTSLSKDEDLEISFYILTGNFSEILPDVRWLRLSNCEVSPPPEFDLKNVVILELPNYFLPDNWSGWKRVEVTNKLKVINLRGCSRFEREPGLSQCASLESIDLADCEEVKGELNISNFRNLKVVRLQKTKISLTGDMGKLQKLEEIRTGKVAWGAKEEVPTLPTSLKRLTISSPRVPNILELIDLEELCFENCREAPEIPGGIWQLTKLKTLKMVNCIFKGGLLLNPDVFLPSSLTCLVVEGLTRLPNLANLSNLTELRLIHFSASEIHGLGKFRALEALEISGSMSLNHLHGLENLVHLKELIVKGCGLQDRFPNLSNLIKLHKLVIVECLSISEIQGLGELKRSLLHLEVSCLDKLVHMDGLDSLEALESLALESTSPSDYEDLNPHEPFPDLSRLQNLKQLSICRWRGLPKVVEFRQLKSLQSLKMKACKSLKRLAIPSSLQNLETLDLSGCIRLVEVPGLGRLGSLQSLDLSNCRSLEELPNLSSLKNLEGLSVSDCFNLVGVIGLEKLESLLVLHMANCRSIKELPDMSGLKNLTGLNLKGCTNLKNVKGLKKLKRLCFVSMERRLPVKHPLQMVEWARKELKFTSIFGVGSVPAGSDARKFCYSLLGYAL